MESVTPIGCSPFSGGSTRYCGSGSVFEGVGFYLIGSKALAMERVSSLRPCWIFSRQPKCHRSFFHRLLSEAILGGEMSENSSEMTAPRGWKRKTAVKNDETHRRQTLPVDLARAMFENTAVGVSVAEIGGRFLFVNPTFRKMYGYTKAELLKLTPLDLTADSDRAANRNLLAQLAAGTRSQYRVESLSRRKDGRLIRVRKTVSLIPADSRAPAYKVAITEDITDRKDDAALRRERQKVLPEVFHRISVMFFLIDGNGHIQLANQESERVLGWSWKEIRNAGIDVFAEMYPNPQDRRTVLDFIAAARSEWADFKTRARDGRTIDIAWAGLRLPDGTTIAIGIEGIGRKRAEETLLAGDVEFGRVTEYLKEALWIVEPRSWRVLYANSAYERSWGWTVSSLDLSKRSFLDVVHPQDRQRVRETLERQGPLPVPTEVTFRIVRPDNSTRWIRERTFPARNVGGAVSFVCLAEDITDRKRADKKPQSAPADLEAAERQSRIGTWALRTSTREITFWSAESFRIFGFDPRTGPPPFEAVLDRFHPEDTGALTAFQQACVEKKDFELDFRIVLPDGSLRYVHSAGHPVLDDDSEMREYTGIAVDVTEQRLAEQALLHSLAQYRALSGAAERVREEERIRLAREIHDGLGQVLAGLKIDFGSLVRHPPRHRSERISKSLEILRHIDEAIQSVRNIATELRPAVLDDLGLAAAIEWAAEAFAARSGTKCVLDLPQEDLVIEPAVATALFRIFQEAMRNIALHAEATEFTVRLAREESGLCLEVRDNGKGFDEAGLETGRALGILGMRERAILLGGRLTIKSSRGAGATISVWMPESRGVAEK